MSSTTPPPADPGGPEYLDQSGGQPVGSATEPGDARGGRRTALVAGGAVVGLALVGGGAWAAMSFFASGPQPAEALPAGTIGYASIDLDPSGGQKIEAFRMISKFPAIEKELDGLDADDDILAKAFEDIEEDCDVNYEDDVQPWLGYRFAVAAVDLGDDLPAPVGVISVKDAEAAEAGLEKLAGCGGEDLGGWVVGGEWAIVAETDDIAQEVSDAAGDGTLADDETYQDWTEEVGDPGVMSMYAAPEAGKVLAELMGTFGGGGMLPGMPMDPMAMDPAVDTDTPAVPEELTRALEDFQGMAATLRFNDGALEFEVAGSAGGEDQMQLFATDRGDDVITTLPEDTAAAFGFGFAEGWVSAALEQVANASGGELTVEDMESELEASTGLTISDLETLAGESAAISLGSNFDAETFFSSSDGSDVPVGAKIQGDAGGIQDVLATIAETMGSEATFVGNDAEGDMVAVGPDPDYRGQLLEDGGLGDSDVYQNVVRESGDANAIAFVNFDAGDWLTSLAEGDQGATDNLEPLQGLGFSSWTDDGASHAVFRLTTND
ncbi:MAG: DUF3352 domain-containing protein [Nocardioides sp.]